ncbi:unnamed protein product [Protopolystoma xenopodis]|uniref:Uncharacterized protein n=1 Tax=Protopolystoma xenopodis TaxID=117903 RepID=A0A3S5AIJ5_9PLAT|nr:unnamed protein product [Protopolystoma xenopodis]
MYFDYCYSIVSSASNAQNNRYFAELTVTDISESAGEIRVAGFNRPECSGQPPPGARAWLITLDPTPSKFTSYATNRLSGRGHLCGRGFIYILSTVFELTDSELATVRKMRSEADSFSPQRYSTLNPHYNPPSICTR